MHSKKRQGDITFYESIFFTKNIEEKINQIWHAKLLIRSSQDVYTEDRCETKRYKEKRKVQRSICGFFDGLFFIEKS